MSRVLPILFNTEMVRAILDGRKTVTRRVVHRGKSYPEYHGKDKFYGVVDHLNNDYKNWYAGFYNDNDVFIGYDGGRHTDALYWKAPCKPGDILYVRETWRVGAWDIRNQMIAFDYKDGTCGELTYIHDRELFERLVNQSREDARKAKCKYNGVDFIWRKGKSPCRWRPSLHMPKEAARIWLKVTDVRVERLQDMKPEDARKEGIKVKPEDCVGKFDYISELMMLFSNLWDSTIKKPDLDRYGWDANPWVWVIEFERCENP